MDDVVGMLGEIEENSRRLLESRPGGSCGRFVVESAENLLQSIARLTPRLAGVKQKYALACLLHALAQSVAQIRGLGSMIEGENADIFEMTLRRYSFELDGVGRSAAEVIRDYGARAAWEEQFGRECWAVPYASFIERMVERIPAPEGCRGGSFYKFLRHLVNFPEDGITTSYRVNIASSMFGPWDSFPATFSSIVQSEGFIGLVNMHKAKEMLESHLAQLAPKTYVIRLSRGVPHLLTITSLDKTHSRHATHERVQMSASDSSPAPLLEFIRRKYSGYSPARFSLKDIVGEVRTVLEYASDLCYIKSSY